MQVIFSTIWLWPTLTWAASVSNTVSDKTISTSAHTDGVTEYYTAVTIEISFPSSKSANKSASPLYFLFLNDPPPAHRQTPFQ